MSKKYPFSCLSTYRELANGAYKSDERKEIYNKRGSEVWEPIQPKGAKLHDKETGFDATVYQNKATGDIVVAYIGRYIFRTQVQQR